MKNILITVILLLSTQICLAQIDFEMHIVETSGNGEDVKLVDLDGDGDLDILGTKTIGTVIVWYENTDGNGTFSSKIGIPGSTKYFVEVSDINNDNYKDVVYVDNKITWKANIDGQGTFGPSNTLTNSYLGTTAIQISDVNSDGFNDIVAVSYANLQWKIAWYENDGQGNFGPPNDIEEFPLSTDIYDIITFDVDNDGDVDIFFTEFSSDSIIKYENIDGLGTFGNRQTMDLPNATAIYACDIDSDGYIDIVATGGSPIHILWFKNDGQGSFGSRQSINDGIAGYFSVVAGDLDGDLDLDIITPSYNANKIEWFENLNGQGDFGLGQDIDPSIDKPFKIDIGDIDGDGDLDIVAGIYEQGGFKWYENLRILEVNKNSDLKFNIIPNPVLNSFKIESNKIISEIKLYNTIGQLIVKKTYEDRVDISIIKSGIYFLQVEAIDGSMNVTKMVKQ